MCKYCKRISGLNFVNLLLDVIGKVVTLPAIDVFILTRVYIRVSDCT